MIEVVPRFRLSARAAPTTSAAVVSPRLGREAKRHPSETQNGALTTRFGNGLDSRRITP